MVMWRHQSHPNRLPGTVAAMSPGAGAAIIAHELGMQRAGLTRRSTPAWGSGWAPTQDPAMFVSTAACAVVAWTWWTFRSWAREQIGDAYLVQVGLAGIYAQVLGNTYPDHDTRDRAVRLWHPEPSAAQAVVPGTVLGAPTALSTTGR